MINSKYHNKLKTTVRFISQKSKASKRLWNLIEISVSMKMFQYVITFRNLHTKERNQLLEFKRNRN